MTLSRNQSISAENLRCPRNLLMYFQLTRSASEMTYIVSSGAINSTHSLQLTRSVLRYLIVKITNKFVRINTPRMCPRLHSVSDGAYRHFCCWSIEELIHYV